MSVIRDLLRIESTGKRKRRVTIATTQLLLGIAGLALITYVCFLLDFHITRTSFAYVIFSRCFHSSAALPSRSSYRFSPQPA